MKLSIFRKNQGQVQFGFTTLSKNNSSIGAVMLEGAPTLKDNPEKCDWENSKIVFKLSDVDIAAILYGFSKDEKISLIHKTEKRTAFFNVEAGTQPGTYKLSMQATEEKEKKVSLYIDSKDKLRLTKYLEGALNKIYF